MAERDDLLFETEDIRGYSVSLLKSQYYNHIISTVDHNAHTEFTPAEIKACVETPEVIWQSNANPSRDLYYGKKSRSYPNLYLRTVVEVDNEAKKGEVVTAHLAKNLSGGKDGGIRYVSFKSKL